MGFAPIRNRAVAEGSATPRQRATRAAGFALRRLATSNEQLFNALALVESPHPEGGAPAEALRDKFSVILDEVAQATGVAPEEITQMVVEQLRQVRAFANLDGGELTSNVRVVGNLIRSGRVELFAG